MPHRDPHSNQEGEVLQDVERAAYATHAAHEWHVAETIYSEEEVAWLPNGAVTSALGLDHPVRAAQLRSGETVLDLGCGGGIDTLLAARAVGPTGQAIGLDMTHEMIVLAQANAAALGLTNTRFLEGDMTALPPTFENDSGLLITPAVLIHPDSLHVMSEVLQEVGEGRESLKRATCLRKDGTSFLIESHVTPFTYKGQPHLLSVTRDITEQAEAEAQLREREEQYRSVFEATHDGLVIFDLDGFIVEANPAYCSLFSYTHDELIGLHASVLFPPDRHSYMAGNLKTLKAGSDFQTRVGRGLRKDGTLFYQSHMAPHSPTEASPMVSESSVTSPSRCRPNNYWSSASRSAHASYPPCWKFLIM